MFWRRSTAMSHACSVVHDAADAGGGVRFMWQMRVKLRGMNRALSEASTHEHRVIPAGGDTGLVSPAEIQQVDQRRCLAD